MNKKLTDLQQYLVDEFVEDYQHGQMSRRDALKRIAAVSGSVAFAGALLAACGPAPTPTMTPPPGTRAVPPVAPTSAPASPTSVPQPAPTSTRPPAPQPTPTQFVLTTTATATVQSTPAAAAGLHVAANDPAIDASDVSFPSGSIKVLAYLAKPKTTAGPVPGILVCHENRGLTEHIKDVTRRLGKAGYVALAVDLLSEQGGTDKVDAAQVPGVLGNTPPEQFIAYFQAGVAYLESLSTVRKAKIGMTGFCFGGGITWRVITKTPQIKAAVPYYGPNPPLEDVPGIEAAVLAMYGELDTRIDAGIPAIEDALKKNNKVFEKMIYPGAAHAFNNDTGANYNAAAATDAWAKMLAWFAKYLNS